MRVKNPFRAFARIVFLKAPIEAQLIVTRRCNLSCGYCNEYDNFSEPIPFEVLKGRIDALHRLRVVNIALLGGEPLLHPKIAEIVAYANRRAQVSITSNGFLLSEKLIERLNEAGLNNMQVSIDTLFPDASSYIQKSMKSIVPKLQRLQRLANFDVNVNVVLCESSKDQFKTTLRELRKFGFFVSVNLIHNARGMVEIDGPDYLALWEHHFQGGTPFSFIEYEYGRQLLQGRRPAWQCRAGARFLYVDEFGKAQFCSAQRGRLNKPIVQYTRKDLRQHSRTYKGCEEGCSIFCVFRDSQVDNAPINVVKALYQALRRGVLFRGRYNHIVAPEEISIPRELITEAEQI
jgi:MoaA/NifB/PqqE/SkfB family radical SAM enzyme